MPKIQIEIGADNSDLQSKISESKSLLKKLEAEKDIQIGLGLDTKALDTQINATKTKLSGLEAQMNKATGATNNFNKSTANGSNTLMNFSRIAQDAPFGIIGIGNNLTATAESFAHLSKQAGGAGNAMKAVLSSLSGIGGILLAVSLVTTALTYMAQNGITMADVFDKLNGKAKDFAAIRLEEGFKSDEVVKATENVSRLTNEVDLAKKGILNKDKVVKDYNDTMGKTTGIVSSLDEVERKLVQGGNAYIQMTLLKASADLARQEAAKASLQAASDEKKSADKFIGVLGYVKSALQGGGINSIIARAETYGVIEKYKSISENKKLAQDNLDIANDFQKKASEIAKKNNFNLFGDNQQTKTKNAKPEKRDVLQLPKLELADPSKQAAEAAKIKEAMKAAYGDPLKEFQNTKIPLNIEMQPERTKAQIAETLGILSEFDIAANEIIQNGIANTFSMVGEAIGNAFATGGNVLAAAGNALLAGLGGILSAMGDYLIQAGTAAVLAGTLVKLFGTISGVGAGLAAIAGGVLLKGIGGALSSSVRNTGNGQGGDQRGGGTSTNTGADSFRTSGSSVSGVTNNSGGTVVFEIAGQKLIGVLNNTTQGNLRLGGSGLVG